MYKLASVINSLKAPYFSSQSLRRWWNRFLLLLTRIIKFLRFGGVPERFLKKWGWYLVAPVIVLLIFFVFLYRDINSQVEEYIANGRRDANSALFSAPARVSVESLLNKSAPFGDPLRQLLLNREYSQVENKPNSPGQFQLVSSNPLKFDIFLRGYINSLGEAIPSERLEVIPQEGKIQSMTRGELQGFTLEPRLLAPFGNGTIRAGAYRTLGEIPDVIKRAVLAIEDRRFYSHWGIDPIGIIRAIAKNIKAKRWVEGGSTITQQLAKNVLLSPRKTLKRKIIEWFAAISLESHLSKDQIFERYLNEVYFAQEASVSVHGIASAAQAFFGKDVQQVTLAEAALLAGLIQAPSAYSPTRHENRALDRRNLVLTRMYNVEEITKEEYESARIEPLKLKPTVVHRRNVPHFKKYLEEHLATYNYIEPEAGVEQIVYTGIDFELQLCAERAVEETIASLEKTYPRIKDKGLEQGLVAIEPFSGIIRAWVGGRNFSKSQFDHVAQARRPIGSTIKPFLYLTAMEKRLNSYKVATPISILSDIPTGITLFDNSRWLPKNYDHKYRGDVTLRYAIEKSLNVPAVYVAQRVGIPALVKTLQLFSIGDKIPKVPALALGSLDASLLQLVSGYGAIANGGVHVSPRPFLSVLDSLNQPEAKTAAAEKNLISEGSAFLMTDILRGAVERGTGVGVRRIGYTGPAAGKTGTSNDARDSWFVGFSSEIVAGVWSGFDDNRVLGLTGGEASVPSWARFMKCAQPYLSNLDFIPPSSIATFKIDTRCYGIATDLTPPSRLIQEIFIKGTEPQRPCAEATPTPVPSEDEFAPEDAPEDSPEPRRKLPKPSPQRTPNERGFWDRVFG